MSRRSRLLDALSQLPAHERASWMRGSEDLGGGVLAEMPERTSIPMPDGWQADKAWWESCVAHGRAQDRPPSENARARARDGWTGMTDNGGDGA